MLSERAFQCLKVFFIQLFLENRDVLQCHLRSELILQSVDVDEDAVEFFLVFVELEEVGGGLLEPSVKRGLEILGLIKQWRLLEVPGGFAGVPVILRQFNRISN